VDPGKIVLTTTTISLVFQSSDTLIYLHLSVKKTAPHRGTRLLPQGADTKYFVCVTVRYSLLTTLESQRFINKTGGRRNLQEGELAGEEASRHASLSGISRTTHYNSI